MPAKPVKIEFIAEVASYLRNVKKVEVSTDDIADALVAVSKDSKDLEKDLDRAMREGRKDTKRLSRVVEELSDDIEDTGKSAKKAGRQIEREFDDAGRIGADAGQELASEFSSNVGEAISSGDIDGLLQGTIGGLVGGIGGPLAFVAGAIGATVVGLFAKAKEETEQLQQDIKDRVDETVQGIFDGFVSLEGKWDEIKLQERVQELIGEMSGEEIEEAKAAAEELGVPWETMLEFLAGDAEAVLKIRDASLEAESAARDAAEGFSTLDNDISKGAIRLEDDLVDALDYVNRKYEDELIPSIEEAGIKSSAWIDYMDGKQVTTTIVVKPGDTFTANFLESQGP